MTHFSCDVERAQQVEALCAASLDIVVMLMSRSCLRAITHTLSLSRFVYRYCLSSLRCQGMSLDPSFSFQSLCSWQEKNSSSEHH